MAERSPKTVWKSLSIICPSCGNDGQRGGSWEKHARVPFRVVEQVIRTFEFAAAQDPSGKLGLLIDTDTDSVDWESGTGLRFECTSCFDSFPIPEGTGFDYE